MDQAALIGINKQRAWQDVAGSGKKFPFLMALYCRHSVFDFLEKDLRIYL